MKNRIRHLISYSVVFTCMLLLLSCATSPKRNYDDLYQKLQGTWEGTDSKGKIGALIFYNDGHVELFVDGKSFSDEVIQGKGTLMYSFDPSKDPMELDLIAVDNYNNRLGVLKMIVQFLADDKIMIRSFFNDQRPTNFSAEDVDNTMVLLRVK